MIRWIVTTIAVIAACILGFYWGRWDAAEEAREILAGWHRWWGYV